MKVYRIIASAFPGLFSAVELKKLDYRELMLWLKEAQIKTIEDSLNLMSTFRVAQSEKEGFNAVQNELKQRILEIHTGQKETILENWKSLKKRG